MSKASGMAGGWPDLARHRGAGRHVQENMLARFCSVYATFVLMIVDFIDSFGI